MTSIYDLSWKRTSFRDKLQLFFASRKECKHKIKWENIFGKADGYSALSSTYYSIVGTALSQFKAIPLSLMPIRLILWVITWFPLATWCYFRMLSLSNQVVELLGYEKMSAEQCDIRQSILRKWSLLAEAKECISSGLAKKPKKIHTAGLLSIGLADIYIKKENPRRARIRLNSAMDYAEEAKVTEPMQATRIYRHCSRLFDLLGDNVRAIKSREKAEDLALKHGAKDQVLKVNV